MPVPGGGGGDVYFATLEELKVHLNRTDDRDDVELLGVLAAGNDVLEYLIEGPVSVRETTEQHEVRTDRIAPRKRPLVSVTSLTPQGGSTPVDSSAYALTGLNSIRLVASLSGWYTLVYQAGWDPLPDRYKLAGLIIVAHLWGTQNGGAGGRVLPGDDVAMVPGLSFAIPARALDLIGTPLLYGFA